ncbi:centrosome-associated protein ALMS1 [Rhinoderma darwinii]|uniref:centrosome-associated protein ALMS1 n=1 Tax=Rhinoderma darwinii TaxID=43563 RepID=UPI003F67852D
MDREEAAAAAAQSWYQLPAEEDASVAMPTLSETVAGAERTDFSSMEEGTLLSETDLRKDVSAGRTRHLEIQDSRLSPCLPLLPADSTPGQRFFEDTLFQKSEVDDFAPLRASLDVSEFPGPPSKSLQMSDAVELASKEITMDQEEKSVSLSQHYLATALDDTRDGDGLLYLSQHPASSSHGEKEDNEPESEVLKWTSSTDVIQPVVEGMGKELRREDGAFLSSRVPAPVLLELLEKEVGMSSSSGRSSRCSSISASAGGSEKVNGMKPQEPDPEHQNSEAGLHLDPRTTSMQSLEESFRDSSEIDFLKDVERETEDPNEFRQINQSGITLRPSFPPFKEALRKQLCSEIQQRFQERDVLVLEDSRKEATGPKITPVLGKTSTETPNKVDDTVVEVHVRDELSMSSRCSIERGHKDTEISHTGNTPEDDGASFIGRLPHPISQSTPGTFTMNRKPLSGRIQQIKAKLTGSDMSLNEEPSLESSPHNVAPAAVPQSMQSSQGYPESSDSQRSLSPQRRRIQSLPSLNYIEKVGAWDTNQSFDALVLRGLTGVSPKKLAYNAVADSLNRLLSRETSATAPKSGLSASFKATSSMTNLNVAERESSTITRSQSYNSVLPDTGENQYGNQTEGEDHETTKTETSQSHVSSRRSSSTRDNARKWVEKTTTGSSAGRHDRPDEETSSEFKDHSQRGQEKAFDKTAESPRHNFVTMDPFSDVSFDPDYANSSQSSNQEKILRESPASAKPDLTGGGGNDNWVPTEETSGKEELDIEERIPMYLRNLGIDQSPTAILTPFAPKGPIREPEFSPSELRTIKGSTATPSRSMRLSEGGSQSAANISQSSLYSSTSTTSVSIPMGSEVGPESPLPTEMPPSFGSGSANDRPISQDDTMTRDVGSGLGVHHVDDIGKTSAEMSPAVRPINDLNSSKTASQGFTNEDHVESTWVKQLIGQFECGGYDGATSHDDGYEQASSIQGYPKKAPTMDPINDSFVGSKTLKEIQKLLAEAEDFGLDGTSSSVRQASPVGDLYTESPSRNPNLEDSLNSRSASPLDLLVKDISWDSSFNSSFTGDHFGKKDLSVACDSLNSSSIRDNSYLGELVGNRNTLAAPFRLQSQWGRSEPEGCSKATTNKMMPSTLQFQDANVRGEREFLAINEKVQRSEQLLSSISSSVGGLKTALAVTRAGYVRGRETESDESSGDSLAARVTSLLKNDTPLTYTARAMQSAEEEERSARGSVKVKLTSNAMRPDTELSDEDRRRIEEIKRELLDQAKEAEKDHSHAKSNKRTSSGVTEEFGSQLTQSPFQLSVTGSYDSAKEAKDISSSVKASDVQHRSTYGGTAKDVSSVMSDGPSQQDPITENHAQETPKINVYELDRPNVSVKSTEEATKPISSITFSSRKRSSPLSSSPNGSLPISSDLKDVYNKSPTNQSTNLRSPHVASTSHDVHHLYYEDPPRSPHTDKDIVAPALVASHQWRPDDSSTLEFLASSWAVDVEYSAPGSRPRISAPSVESFNTFPSLQEENVDPVRKNVIPERSLVINHGLQMKGNDGDVQPKTHRGMPSAEDAGGDELFTSPSQKFQTRATMSSPTRKALSCLHVTISPKEDLKVLDVSKARETLDPDNASKACQPRANQDPSRTRSSSNLSGNDQVLSHNNLSAGTVPPNGSQILQGFSLGDHKPIHEDFIQFLGKENIPDRLVQSERRRSPLSDATTQITTEGPDKTTFSAEIFVEGSREASASSIPRVKPTPERPMTSRTPMSCLSRATDQPLLLPYRPPGSPELFYVPFMESGSRMSPVSTIESSHPGSNDAIAPKFPTDVLGAATEKLSDPSIPRHREGIYSKEPSPKTAEWRPKPARGPIDDLDPSRPPAKLTLAPQKSQAEKDSGSFSEMSSRPVHPTSCRSREGSDAGGLRPYPGSSLQDNEFLPLQPEIDYSQEQQSHINLSLRSREEATEGTTGKKTHPATPDATDVPGRSDKSAQTRSRPPSSSRDCRPEARERNERGYSRIRAIAGERSQSIVSDQSLDHLWARYTESRRRAAAPSSNLEMSLVERLERLARLLQNPPPLPLTSSKDEKNRKEETDQKRETTKTAREQWYRRKLGGDSLQSLDDLSDGSFGKPYEDSGSQHSEPVSEERSTVTDTATAESQVGSEALSGTTGSSAASTIDTIRLINAFGPERVLPSSRLGRLYSTIDFQKKRTEGTVKGSKRAPAGRGQSRMEIQELPKSRSKMADAESIASSNSLWEPSPALRRKKSSRSLNKGAQAGELEIVMSATRRNTRDVGTTFPSPGGERLKTTTDPAAAVNVESNMNTSHTKVTVAEPHVPPGMSWFVPAADLKSESQKENERGVRRGPGPVWYQPVTGTKPWREPLREKNEQDQVPARPEGPTYGSRVLAPDKTTEPFIKVTLQESLRSHRPDFIFRSGQRVKRLQLLAEERKLQSEFQCERDELFNRPARSGAPPYKDSRISQQNRTIPKKEMIQRSKRIYQQLPEITKRKEEEKRRSEYETYRLKAQLFRKKVTNHILGRKTPWN